MTTQEQTQSLPAAIYDAYVALNQGGDAGDARATLKTLREQHGDAAFEAAKIKALIAFSRLDR